MRIDLTIKPEIMKKNAAYCKEKGIIIPTFQQMRHPETISDAIKDELSQIGLWDVHPRNLFRINWKNDPISQSGGFGNVNYMVLPPSLTGVKAKILALTGKWFPTGAHKVGATFGCLVPRLVTGQFDPTQTKAVWPSTGNFCRGGAYVSALLSCDSVAILPENMSRERFEWLSQVAGEVIATPGCESNVKEIFDKCWELKETRRDIQIFNQFEEMGNPLWHYNVTGPAFKDALDQEMKDGDRLAGAVFSSGSGGALGSGYYLKSLYPQMKLGACEALQCPTMLLNGFGDHRIEGIGDKHIPWIHDLKQTDMAIAVDDEHTIRLLRLFNEEVGREVLNEHGIPGEITDTLDLLGISSIGNLLSAIKFAKYFELTENDYVVTIFTDSMQLYRSRISELAKGRGNYTKRDAHFDLEMLQSISTDSMMELNYYEKKRIHNLKYFTWIEQQQRALQELNDQWYEHESYWSDTFNEVEQIDELIKEFNSLAQ